MQFTLKNCYITVCSHHDACNTAKTICNPGTALKSDHATKSIVTLLFIDIFQKCKNSVKAIEIIFWKVIVFLVFMSYQV